MGILAGRIVFAFLVPALWGAPAAVADDGPTIPCRVTAVREPCRLEVAWRGTTYTVRLAEVECPSAGSEWGDRVLRATRLLLGEALTVDVKVEGDRSGNRITGRVLLPARLDLGSELVARGLAWAERGAAETPPELLRAEAAARSAGRGLWGDPAGPGPDREPPASRPAITITDPAPTTPQPGDLARIRQSSCRPRSECCKVCSKGKACGASCISASYTCHKGRGCACDASEICW